MTILAALLSRVLFRWCTSPSSLSLVGTKMKLTDDNDSLYGCTCGQVLFYLSRYYIPGDHTHVKALVCHFRFALCSEVHVLDDCMTGCSALVYSSYTSAITRSLSLLPRILDTGKIIADSMVSAVCRTNTSW